MVAIERVRVSLTGFKGGPGVSTFYAVNAGALVPALHAMYDALRTKMPLPVTINVENSGDILEATTGELQGSWSVAPVTQLLGVSAAAYSAPSGACLTWLTTTVANGKRVKGRTFLVPMQGDAYDTDGSLAATVVPYLNAVANDFVVAGAANFCVWHRPFLGSPATATKPARPAFAGSRVLVTGSRVLDKVAVLRSRRD